MNIIRPFFLVVALLTSISMARADDVAAVAGIGTAETTEQSREQARKANKDAVEDAAEAIVESNRLDLDIRLIGTAPFRIADNRSSDRQSR